ncbi:acetyltransferase AlgX (SGNH hydrolase-like protein) [Rhodopseudomonas thermotolerans]|uniref:Acetyltransferase AlgX (SGNH hydrolase-like protein) n=2 Tax=Rhodopseudomonas TaxID=1073 RepID=A0A336JXG3_9BRAD|nr:MULTISPECIES: alginate O-acetyltransferase [Rhodopseudomonas]RED25827.1 acetyltransferase AlgX (SGNH hydrolase-like protein) [Rhodopseudomonas pentothenatexigens]REF90961.1 acetyltransferase AlgX (SGNH hydrolase-like protein) [Rhodopseudomonas thermotolerans]SSW93046.1 acetyltransferase AlgX (SGNH hydrolase-like protein) [Rhodopseudomonas pentothenatexigens]
METLTTSSGRWLRRLAAAAFVAMPALTLWNLAVPSRAVRIGPGLVGVTQEVPFDLSLRGFVDGALQKAAALRIADAMPLRRTLIRLNNQIAYSLFGEITAPGVLVGRDGELVQRSYLEEYCSRAIGQADTMADAAIPLLRDIQAYYRDRGKLFLYIVTPSKVADMPDKFTHLIACPSSPQARAELVPAYVARLRAAGIDVLDLATATHAMRSDATAPFPRSGIHWNDLAMARGSRQIVDAINAQAGRELLPPFSFSATVSRPAEGRDRDLAELANLLVAPIDYPTPKLTYSHPPCAGREATRIDAALVGTSFIDPVSEVLTEQACLTRLGQYFYLKLGRSRGGVRQNQLSEAELRQVRDVDLMLLEENESLIGRQAYLSLLHRIVTAP